MGKLYLFIIIFHISISAISQTSWESAGTLYSDNGVTVELKYKVKSDSCEPNSNKKSKYSYVLSGTLSGSNLFLNWKMDYYTCSGLIMCQTNSVNIGVNNLGEILETDYIFNGYKIKTAFYDVQVSSTPDNTPVFSKGVLKSNPPTNIIHDKQIFPGESAILKIEDGELGLGSEWVWYKDNCFGTPIGKGKLISTVPINSSTYYVRAEGLKDTTTCISASVKVSENSIIGDSIKGSSFICRGDKDVKLTLVGGKLGKNAEWKWYKDDCVGTSIGSGRTIEISPIGNTTYFVRAEGNNDISICLKKEIVVTDKSSQPISILGNATVCKGEFINLSVNGGKLSAGSIWTWYKDFISTNNKVAIGESINFKPISNSLYIVRGEGACNNTESVNKNITVNEPSQSPYAIKVNNTPYTSNLIKNKTNTFTVVGGSLAQNANWVWYKTDNSNTQDLIKVGNGESIKIKLRKNTILKVRAEGDVCDNNREFLSKSFTVSETNNYMQLNFGLSSSIFTTNSSVSPTASPYNIVVTYAKNNNSSKVNWYLKGKYSIGGVQSDYNTNDVGTITSTNSTTASTYPIFNGKIIEERYGATAGLLFGGKTLKLFLGGGWGKRDLKWGVSEVSSVGQANIVTDSKWATNFDRHYEGYEIETGILMKISFLNIQAGISTITPTLNFNADSDPKELKYFDTHFGIGFNF